MTEIVTEDIFECTKTALLLGWWNMRTMYQLGDTG